MLQEKSVMQYAYSFMVYPTPAFLLLSPHTSQIPQKQISGHLSTRYFFQSSNVIKGGVFLFVYNISILAKALMETELYGHNISFGDIPYFTGVPV